MDWIILNIVSVALSSLKYFFPSLAINFSCTIFSYTWLPPESNLRFKSYQYRFGMEFSVNASITSITEKTHFSFDSSHCRRIFFPWKLAIWVSCVSDIIYFPFLGWGKSRASWGDLFNILIARRVNDNGSFFVNSPGIAYNLKSLKIFTSLSLKGWHKICCLLNANMRSPFFLNPLALALPRRNRESSSETEKITLRSTNFSIQSLK